MARKNKRNMKNKNSGGLTSIQWAGIAVIVVIHCGRGVVLLDKPAASTNTDSHCNGSAACDTSAQRGASFQHASIRRGCGSDRQNFAMVIRSADDD